MIIYRKAKFNTCNNFFGIGKVLKELFGKIHSMCVLYNYVLAFKLMYTSIYLNILSLLLY